MSSNQLPLKKQLEYTVDLRIPHFLKSVPQGTVGQRSFKQLPTAEWYQTFVERVTNAIGRKYLPVFRIGDGEFYFSIGYRPPRPSGGTPKIWHYFRTYLGALRVGRFPGRFKSGSPAYGWEEFAYFEWLKLRKEYKIYLRAIANEGILAPVFTLTNPPFSEQYFEPYCDWLDRNQIPLTLDNYFPVYFVYALLNGPDNQKIYKGNRILVVTSYDQSKKSAIEQRLLNLGARSVEFHPVSRDKALKDDIAVEKIQSPIDMAIVAAGVGSAKVLFRLKPLKTLCIDAGYCIDILADPKKRQNRVFCIPDDMLPSGQ